MFWLDTTIFTNEDGKRYPRKGEIEGVNLEELYHQQRRSPVDQEMDGRVQKIEWFLRIAVFGSALFAGVITAWSIWTSTGNLQALLLFILTFLTLFLSVAYIVRMRKLRMLQT